MGEVGAIRESRTGGCGEASEVAGGAADGVGPGQGEAAGGMPESLRGGYRVRTMVP